MMDRRKSINQFDFILAYVCPSSWILVYSTATLSGRIGGRASSSRATENRGSGAFEAFPGSLGSTMSQLACFG